ncbi:hypothetical protein ABZ446_26580 [Streptomyces sp. NPDC005813]|uniref:hypothetical protein n=1 Tax=Streptomyces sp. NPDC005813 TaxID=3155592 RepID=UPI0033C6741B
MAGPELHEVLADPANWLWSVRPKRHLRLAAPQSARECWFDGAHPTADTSALPTWDELRLEEREVLVCAAEASGMLTGAFGIWEDPSDDLDIHERLAWVDQQLAPLLPFVREGWIEVQHYPDEDSDAFTVMSLDEMRAALCHPRRPLRGRRMGRRRRMHFHLRWAGGLARRLEQRMGTPPHPRPTLVFPGRRATTTTRIHPTRRPPPICV